MTFTNRTLLPAICLLASSMAYAIDTSDTILCAVTQVNECRDGSGCQSVLPEMVNAPTFIWVDIDKKTIRTNRRSNSRAVNGTTIDGRHILQGADDGNPEEQDGAGWTLSIEDDTGRLAGAVVVEQAVLGLFGACTELP